MSNRKPSPINDMPKSKRRKQDISGLQKPKRPLSAYNLFFRDERSRYLEERTAKKIHDPLEKSPFLAMSAEISKRWMNLPLEKRQKYNSLAEEETIKYHVKVDAYKTKQREMEQPDPVETKRNESDSRQGAYQALTANSLPFRSEDQTSFDSFSYPQAQVSSNSDSRQSGLSQSSLISRSLLSHQPPQVLSGALHASVSREDNMLFQQLMQQQQLESSSALQALLRQRLQHPSSNQDITTLNLASLRRDDQGELTAPQDDEALLRSILQHQENFLHQQQIAGLAQIADLVDRELHHRITMLSNTDGNIGIPAQNQSLQGQARAVSFLPTNATDISNAISPRPSNFPRSDHASSQGSLGRAFQGSLYGSETKEASPLRDQATSATGFTGSARDDILFRMLLANQTQNTSNLAMLPGDQAALTQQQQTLNQSSQLIAALTQGWRANREEPKDPPNPSPM